MAFTSFTNLASVVKKYKLLYRENVCEFDLLHQAPASLHEEITLNRLEIPYQNSEIAIGETILFPILKAVWLEFKDFLTLWSHTALELDDILTGYPDYLLASKSDQGKIILGTPFLAVVEAKKDDFTAGWGQCAAEMYAIQQLNKKTDLEILGMVSNGDYWQFAFLKENIFKKCKNNYTIDNLDSIYNFMVSHLKNVLKEFPKK
ncbi:MAG: hypothetical protein EAZ97_10235 [Bacteroidetes bacterium]|nr:MAG: hypothetical protein EAZ97_10235 [Bacteroidota bacterium]